jgi:hypothetical protein
LSDPSATWLNIMNISLGLVVLICCAAVALGVLQELAARRRKRASASQLDRELNELIGSYGGHAFHVPGLGVTMADGGEPVNKKEER